MARLCCPILAIVLAASLALAEDAVRVGVYTGPGSNQEDREALRAALSDVRGLDVRRVPGEGLPDRPW